MKTSTRFSRSSSALAVAVALAVAGGAAGAAAPEGPGRPAAEAERSCARSLQADTDARGAALSEHVRKVLGTDDADLDGTAGPCRLVDGYLGENVYINYGPDSATLLEQVDELLAQLRALAGEDEDEGPADASRRAVRLETSPRDHLLHAYLFKGGRKIDLGPLPAHGDGAAPGQRFVPWQGPAGNADSAAPAGNLLAVAEPSSYAMLLAGMLLLGALRLRRPRAPQRP